PLISHAFDGLLPGLMVTQKARHMIGAPYLLADFQAGTETVVSDAVGAVWQLWCWPVARGVMHGLGRGGSRGTELVLNRLWRADPVADGARFWVVSACRDHREGVVGSTNADSCLGHGAVWVRRARHLGGNVARLRLGDDLTKHFVAGLALFSRGLGQCWLVL